MVNGNRLVLLDIVPNTLSKIKPQVLNVRNHLLKQVRVGQHERR